MRAQQAIEFPALLDRLFVSSQWEEVDHDFDDTIAGLLTSPGGANSDAEIADPLGLGSSVKYDDKSCFFLGCCRTEPLEWPASVIWIWRLVELFS